MCVIGHEINMGLGEGTLQKSSDVKVRAALEHKQPGHKQQCGPEASSARTTAIALAQEQQRWHRSRPVDPRKPVWAWQQQPVRKTSN